MRQYPNKDQADQAMEKGDFSKALELYSLALEKEPDNPVIYCDRGVCFFNNKQFDKALEDLNVAQKLDPDNPYRYSSRAFVKGALKDTLGAIADYQMAITLDPEDAISRNNLGLMQEKIGYWDQAKKNFEVADELAGILKNRQIAVDKNEQIETPKTSTNDLKKIQENDSLFEEAKNVFTSRLKFREFLRFVKNGFKLD